MARQIISDPSGDIIVDVPVAIEAQGPAAWDAYVAAGAQAERDRRAAASSPPALIVGADPEE